VVAVFLTSLALVSGDMQEDAEAAFLWGVKQAATDPRGARQRFAEAASRYEQVRQSVGSHPLLERNLGNAYLLASDPDDAKTDNLARAILAYRRGLRLEPTDRELRRNLEYARQQVIYPPPGNFGQPPVDHRPPWLPRWPGVLFALASGCYALACLTAARWWMVRRGKWATIAACGFALMLLFLAAWGAEVWQLGLEIEHPMVVIAQDGVQLLKGNGPRYPPAYETPLNRGVEARLRYDRGRWLQIELAGGEIGWVPRTAVLVNEP
jgi:hypothetical protein